MTDGMKTSEFWVTSAIALINALAFWTLIGLEKIPADAISIAIATFGSGVPTSAYALSRGLAKKGGA